MFQIRAAKQQLSLHQLPVAVDGHQDADADEQRQQRRAAVGRRVCYGKLQCEAKMAKEAGVELTKDAVRLSQFFVQVPNCRAEQKEKKVRP